MSPVEFYLNHVFNMWNVNMYSVLSQTKPFYLLSLRCHCTIKIPEHALETFGTSCLQRTTSEASIQATDHCDVYSEICVRFYRRNRQSVQHESIS